DARRRHVHRPPARRVRAMHHPRGAPQRDAHPGPPRQDDDIAVIHTRQRERIDTFGGQAVGDLFAHRFTSMWSVAKSAVFAGAGAPSNSARAAVVLGTAITSRSDPAPARSITTRSNPIANPPAGAAPACRPV